MLTLIPSKMFHAQKLDIPFTVVRKHTWELGSRGPSLTSAIEKKVQCNHWRLNHLPSHTYSPLVTQNVTVFGYRNIEDVKWSSLVGSPLWTRRETLVGCEKKKGHTRTHIKLAVCKTGKAGFKTDQTCPHLWLNFQPQNCDKLLLYMPPSLWWFIMAA